MSRIRRIITALSFLWMPVAGYAAIHVFACEPEWGALSQELGGDAVKVFTATTAHQDPHHIQARPSLIAHMRRADMVVCTGAELEIGWLPLLLRAAHNGKVQPGRPGYFLAAAQVRLLERPARLDRAEGDIHAQGNPHIHMDPHNIARVARALAQRMAEIDPADAGTFQSRLADFEARWQDAISRWEKRGAPLKGVPVVVHHRQWVYLIHWLGMQRVGELEPKPGVPPTPGHLAALQAQLKAQPAKLIIHAAYEDPAPARWLSQRTGIPEVTLPFTVGGSKRAKDLFSLFDDTLDRLLEGLK